MGFFSGGIFFLMFHSYVFSHGNVQLRIMQQVLLLVKIVFFILNPLGAYQSHQSIPHSLPVECRHIDETKITENIHPVGSVDKTDEL